MKRPTKGWCPERPLSSWARGVRSGAPYSWCTQSKGMRPSLKSLPPSAIVQFGHCSVQRMHPSILCSSSPSTMSWWVFNSKHFIKRDSTFSINYFHINIRTGGSLGDVPQSWAMVNKNSIYFGLFGHLQQ